MVYHGLILFCVSDCDFVCACVCLCLKEFAGIFSHIYIFPSARFSIFNHLSGSQRGFQQISQRSGGICSLLRRFWVWARGLLPVGHVQNASRGSLAGSTLIRSPNHLNWLLLHIKEWWLYFIRIYKLPTLSPRMGPGPLQMKLLSPDCICILLFL